jgi:hypothetical protein
MKNMVQISSSLFLLGLSLSAVALDSSYESDMKTNMQHVTPSGCSFEQVVFEADFEAARLQACKKINSTTYELTIDAENRPINPSPWYAFKVKNSAAIDKSSDESIHDVSENSDQILIMINAIDARPRYAPQVQQTNGTWEALDFSVHNNKMVFAVSLGHKPLKIAAQPIISNQDYENWTDAMSQKGIYKKVLIGSSTQGRAIHGLIKQHSSNHEWLVLIGRQHPPELTGAIAFKQFSQTLNHSSPALDAFYKRFNVLMVPNVNPDGVAHGNWRHNVNGTDLNRDWGKFTQTETRTIGDYITSLLTTSSNDKPSKLVLALDFHSTQQDIFYTMPNDYHVAPSDFSDTWLESVKANTVSSFVVRNRPGSRPDSGVFKQYIADTYHVHAITYEMGDNTPSAMIDHVAQVSATTLVDKMLATDASEFVYIEKDKE